MAIEVSIKNPDISNKERTWFTAASLATATSLTVRDSTNFAANDYGVAGNVGEELTECKKISSITSTTAIAIAAMTNPHPNGTLLQKTDWNQYSLEFRTSSSGSWSVLTTADLDWDDKYTIYSHSIGTSTSQYRFRFYNSQTAAYSEYSGTLVGSGYTSAQVGYMVNQIRLLINDLDSKVVTDEEIIRFINDGQDEISAVRPDWYFLLTENNTTTTTVGIREYSFPSDFRALESLRFRYISTTSTSSSTSTSTTA